MEHHQAESEIGEAPTLNSKAHILSPKPLLTQPDLDSATAQDGQSVFIVALLTMLMICQFVSAKGSTRESHRHAQHVCNTHTLSHTQMHIRKHMHRYITHNTYTHTPTDTYTCTCYTSPDILHFPARLFTLYAKTKERKDKQQQQVHQFLCRTTTAKPQ